MPAPTIATSKTSAGLDIADEPGRFLWFAFYGEFPVTGKKTGNFAKSAVSGEELSRKHKQFSNLQDNSLCERTGN
jgi:hypothetical protein